MSFTSRHHLPESRWNVGQHCKEKGEVKTQRYFNPHPVIVAGIPSYSWGPLLLCKKQNTGR
jgi:hypothetical protein